MKRVLVAGEINADLILQGYRTFPAPGKEVLVDDFEMVLGSASAICAMGLARLGTPVAFAGVVGDDLWGAFCLEAMRGRGIDVTRVRRDPAVKTGLTVAISSPRDRALVSFLGAIGALLGRDVDDGTLRAFDHLHVSSYYLQQGLRPDCADLFARAKRFGLTTSLDPGFDPTETWGLDLKETLHHVDLFFPNEVEAAALAGTSNPLDALRALGNDRTRSVLKLGARGAAAIDENGTMIVVPGVTVVPVDTTGAGDSFDAGFLHAWLAGEALPACLRLGVACGALSTLGLGGTARQAKREEAEAFLEKSGR